jgi:hypothetical protein
MALWFAAGVGAGPCRAAANLCSTSRRARRRAIEPMLCQLSMSSVLAVSMALTMEIGVSQKSEFLSQNLERRKMHAVPAVVEARDMLCAAVPFEPERDTKRSWIRRASSALGIDPAKGKRIFYREVKRIDADTFARMRDRLDALQETAATRRERLNDLATLRSERRSRSSS